MKTLRFFKSPKFFFFAGNIVEFDDPVRIIGMRIEPRIKERNRYTSTGELSVRIQLFGCWNYSKAVLRMLVLVLIHKRLKFIFDSKT